MNLLKLIGVCSTLSLAMLAPSFAFADDEVRTTTEEAAEEAAEDARDARDDGRPREVGIGRGTPSEALPAPRSDDDPQPPAAQPRVPVGGVVKQAGVGGMTAYGRSGVVELGGAANFTRAADFTQVSVNPSIGWFFMDNVELSAILGLSHLSAEGIDSTFVTALVEPSLHIPFTDTVFGMLGAGVGLSWIDGPGLGFAFAPRAGVNVLVGRSGILTPQFFMQYATHEALVTPNGALLAVSVSYGAGLGYTVMW